MGRDGNLTRLCRYPWVSYPMGVGTGMETYPRVYKGWIPVKIRVGCGYQISLLHKNFYATFAFGAPRRAG